MVFKFEMISRKLGAIGIFFVILIAILSIIGCATPNVRMAVRPGVLYQESYDIVLNPQLNKNSKADSYLLTINNKTSSNIELDWNKTFWVQKGSASGGFMFDGIPYEDREKPKPPDIILPNTKFEKIIFPNELVVYMIGRYRGFFHGLLPAGRNGIYLTLKIDGEEINEKVVCRISHEKAK